MNDIHSNADKLDRELVVRPPLLPRARQFDFDVGYLKKSPCKACLQRPLLPHCVEKCEMLDRIQTRLARGISTTHSHSPLEPFAIFLEGEQDK